MIQLDATVTRSEMTTLLLDIASRADERDRKIREFQQYVWHTDKPPSGFDDRDWEIMADLAHDLDYYEGNPEWRHEDASFYGEERLVREIHESIAKLINS